MSSVAVVMAVDVMIGALLSATVVSSTFTVLVTCVALFPAESVAL